MKHDVMLGKYYVKEHMDLVNCQNADLRELFVYKLLDLIKLEPKVYTICALEYT